MGGNILISASAGTGKTYRLVTHFMTLLERGVRPEEIVALTFSRAAAGEIFDALVERLVKSERAKQLRELIAVQHLCAIGTIDSFLMKIIRTFPLELGMGGTVSVLGDYERALALQDALERALLNAGREDARELMRTILAMFATSGKKSLAEALDRIIDELLDFYADNLDKQWGVSREGMPAEDIPSRAGRHRELAARLGEIGGTLDEKQQEAFGKIVEFVASFNGRFTRLSTPVGNLLKAIDFENSAINAFSLNRKRVQFDKEQTETVLGVFRELLDEAIAVIGIQSAAVGNFLKLVYGNYRSNWTEQGRITFGDMPRLIARLPDDAKLALEYRFDSKFEHWALDEFQDTNHSQWNALKNLIDEASQSPERSVFVVGDVKQAIYGWRGGAVEIFKGEIDSGAYAIEHLNDSKRYGSAIAEKINAVFGGNGERSALYDEISARNAKAAETWRSLWNDHTSDPELTERGCFICETAGDALPDDENKYMPYVRIIAAELERIEFKKREMKCAILVRSGKDGVQIAQELRKCGYRAVFEGDTGIFDVPVVAYLAELAAWAEHPGSAAAAALFACGPFEKVELAQPEAFLRSATRIGLARTYRTLIEALPKEAVEDELVKLRLEELVRAAVKFETVFSGELRLDTFKDFLERESVGNIADDASIAVMTIHHSKGLSKTVTFLPVFETFGMDKAGQRPVVAGNCVLKRPDQAVMELDPQLSEYERAQEAERIFEEICVNYVSFTRSKKELFVILPKEPKSGSSLKFSTIVRNSVGDAVRHGDTEWYRTVEEIKKSDNTGVPAPEPRRFAKRTFRSVPSASAETLFAADIFRSRAGAASARGTDYHLQMAAVEFDDALYGGALRKPDDFTGLWRERSYEFYDVEKDRWESGVFDRVVFTGSGAERCATVCDFKTNTPRSDESEEQFISRMKECYRGQMRAYRRAVSALTGIDEARVRTLLLLEKPDRAVEVEWS